MTHLIRKILSYLPTKLPSTQEQFQVWSEDILAIGGFPVNDTFKRALASMLQRVAQEKTHAPKAFFIKAVQTSIICEMAWYALKDLNAKIDEQAKAKTADGSVVQEIS